MIRTESLRAWSSWINNKNIIIIIINKITYENDNILIIYKMY